MSVRPAILETLCPAALRSHTRHRLCAAPLRPRTPTAGLRDSALQPLRTLDLQAGRNAVLSAGLAQAPSGRLQQRRLQNMLASINAESIRWVAKSVHRDYWQDFESLAAANQSLLRKVQLGTRSGYHRDALRWMLKTLARRVTAVIARRSMK